ncbi:transposase [Candidatus Roizmanbacteria bacterium]|nr:transposase [Candidatus Roizmanbacteria bacterium]
MPSRKITFANGRIYHIYNKTLEKKHLFDNQKLGYLFLDLISYYRSTKATLRYLRLKELNNYLAVVKRKDCSDPKFYRVDLMAYCLMPTHYHLLLKQTAENGAMRFMADIINSFTRYVNIATERKGPIFLTQFKASYIRAEDELKHVSRYIHLNPYSGGLVRNYSDLLDYQFSSLKEYVKLTAEPLSATSEVLSLFQADRTRYKRFVLSNAEYQKRLERAKRQSK